MRQKIVFLVLVFLSVVLALSLFRNVAKLNKAREETQRKRQELAEKGKEKAELEKKLKEVQKPKFVEKQLRDKLDLVKEGEILVVLPPPEEILKAYPFEENKKEEDIIPNWKKWVNEFF